MTTAEKATAAEERRQRALERARECIERESSARTYGAVTLHMQAGLVVRVEVVTSTKITEP